MTLEKFTIKLQRASKTYKPGEIIAGELIVDLDQTKHYRGVKLKFLGECNIQFTDFNNRPTKGYAAREKYFEKEVYVYRDLENSSELSPGSHIFPFTFELPTDVPNTFFHAYGQVSYSIEAIIIKSGTSQRKASRSFIVLPGPYSNQFPITPIETVVGNDYYHCLFFCKKVGSMQAHIKIPNNTAVPGEFIKLDIDLDQGSGSVLIQNVLLKLKRHATFYTGPPAGVHRSDTTVLATKENKGPFPVRSALQMELEIPSTAPWSGLQHCQLIDISYTLQIIFETSSFHVNNVSEHDIIVGRGVTPSRTEIVTAPELGVLSELPEETAALPSSMPMPYGFNTAPYPVTPAHPLPTDSLDGPLTRAQISIASAPSNPLDPPPSYESVMAEMSRK